MVAGGETAERRVCRLVLDEGATGSQWVVGPVVGDEGLNSQPLGHSGQVLTRVLSHAPAAVLAGRVGGGEIVEETACQHRGC